MFETKTYENLLAEALARVSDDMDKREGSIIYDAIAPACAELAQAYIDADTILTQTFADTATENYLERRTSERGITREGATNAIVKAVFVPADVVSVGDRFSCSDLNYTVTGEDELTCDTAGTIANSVTGQLIPINYIRGLESATITEILKPAEDDEDDESLRDRYFESLRSQAYGGNIADYMQKTKAIDGVGAVKVTPVWNGGGTVKLTLLASDYSVPTDYLIDNVQTIIDPTQDGCGVGIAPIGHVVTVEPATATSVNIATTITYADGWNFENTKEYIYTAIDNYLLELRKEWENSTNTVVRISQLETRILSCDGVLDIADTLLNGESKNLQLDKYCVPVRGTFNGVA